MASFLREMLVLVGWLALAALIITVVGLILAPLIWSHGPSVAP